MSPSPSSPYDQLLAENEQLRKDAITARFWKSSVLFFLTLGAGAGMLLAAATAAWGGLYIVVVAVVVGFIVFGIRWEVRSEAENKQERERCVVLASKEPTLLLAEMMALDGKGVYGWDDARSVLNINDRWYHISPLIYGHCLEVGQCTYFRIAKVLARYHNLSQERLSVEKELQSIPQALLAQLSRVGDSKTFVQQSL